VTENEAHENVRNGDTQVWGDAFADSTGSPLVVEVSDLQTHFLLGSHVVKALDGVSFRLHRGETLGIVGVSGSGKSVLARSMMGLVREPGRIVGGRVSLLNENLLEASRSRLTALRGRELALIVSSPKSRLNPVLNVGTQVANVLMAKQAMGKRAAQKRAIELLQTVAIGDPARVAQSLPHELSGGMCQRVIIIMALANSPRLLLADEPTAGLDVTVQAQVLDLMMKLVHETGSALMLMTRDLGIIAHYAERVAVLSKGQIIEQRSVTEFFTSPTHPHSLQLLNAAFSARGRQGMP
jgi:ABC-type dipeptide/oligopeptide/nickel transport system ATPase component